MFNVVLVAPEIPPNTGNVIRLCSNTGCSLHLIKPLGFELDDKRLRRAGLDYREFVDIRTFETFDDYVKVAGAKRIYMFSKFHENSYVNTRYLPGDSLVFGSETRGLPEFVRMSVAPKYRVTLPMKAGNRSLNLSNAVAVAVYEAWRQNDFSDITP